MNDRDSGPLTIAALLKQRAEERPDAYVTFHRRASGEWVGTSWAQFFREITDAAARFVARGIGRGDRVAIIGPTCPDWQIAELGAIVAGAVVVGIDAQASPQQIDWVLTQCHARALILDRSERLNQISASTRGAMRCIFAFHGDTLEAGVDAWHPVSPGPSSGESWTVPAAAPDDPVMLIYTSGTTGTPKGIQYTNRQLLSACWAMRRAFPDFEEARLVCWLPMAALFQRMMNLLAGISRATTYFVEDPREIVSRMQEIRPTIFTSVPRFYEKLHDAIRAKIEGQPGVAGALARRALATGDEWARHLRAGRTPGWRLRIRHAIFDRLVLRKIRGVVGGDIKWLISGSAAAPVWLLEFFHAIGLLVLEAYGVTENPLPVAANRPTDYRFGSVGRPFAGNAVRFGTDNEVLVKGESLFTGYLGDDSSDRFTTDGYYRTGDAGRVDEDGFLYLTGRLSELIKTSGGRRISPMAVEAVYRASAFVDQIVVIGNNRPYLVAVVTLNEGAVRAALRRVSPTREKEADLASDAATKALLEEDFARLSTALAKHEQVRAFVMLREPFSVEQGELTPTLKFRRDRIEQRHRAAVDDLYQMIAVPVLRT